jgi:hypothetical protein
MSSISCWTSATRCSNNLVSHPTSNSYPYLHFYWPIHRWRSYPFVCRAPVVRASPSIQDSVVGYVSCYQGAILGVWVRAFDGGRRRHFEVDAIMRTRGRFLWPTAATSTRFFLFVFRDLFALVHSRWPIPFRRFISPRHHLLDMRRDVQEIFRATPHHKQVMMFSATLAKEIRVTCKKFMANVCGFASCPFLF